MIERFVSVKYPFLMLRDTETKEIRFSPLDGRTADQQWATAVEGKHLENMLKEYKRLKGQL